MKKITISKIIELRKKTNLGVIECKKALEINDGNIYNAFKFLKKKWNEYSEYKINNNNNINNYGIVIASTNINNNIGSIIVLSCESDFVSKNSIFLKVAKYIANASLIFSDKKSILDFKVEEENIYIKDMISEIIGTMKENISFSFKKLFSPFICSYNHTGNKIASLVGFSNYFKGLEIVGKNIAMQIVAMKPNCIYNNNDVKCLSLMDQNFIKNDNISVEKYLNDFNKNLKILDFKMIKL